MEYPIMDTPGVMQSNITSNDHTFGCPIMFVDTT